MSALYGIANILTSDHNNQLFNFINQRPALHNVNSDMPMQLWAVKRPTPIRDDVSMVITFYDTTGGGQRELALTLSHDGPQSGMIDIVLEQLRFPTPPEQMWIMENAITPPVFPPFAVGKICNGYKRDLCMGAGGNTPIPLPFTPVAAIHGDGQNDQKWMVRYQSVA